MSHPHSPTDGTHPLTWFERTLQALCLGNDLSIAEAEAVFSGGDNPYQGERDSFFKLMAVFDTLAQAGVAIPYPATKEPWSQGYSWHSPRLKKTFIWRYAYFDDYLQFYWLFVREDGNARARPVIRSTANQTAGDRNVIWEAGHTHWRCDLVEKGAYGYMRNCAMYERFARSFSNAAIRKNTAFMPLQYRTIDSLEDDLSPPAMQFLHSLIPKWGPEVDVEPVWSFFLGFLWNDFLDKAKQWAAHSAEPVDLSNVLTEIVEASRSIVTNKQLTPAEQCIAAPRNI